MILSGGLMLRHLGYEAEARRLETAIARVLATGRIRTADLRPEGPPATTTQVADAIVEAIDEL
jgi:isocitrate/isopropylmalate dehydrogenase